MVLGILQWLRPILALKERERERTHSLGPEVLELRRGGATHESDDLGQCQPQKKNQDNGCQRAIVVARHAEILFAAVPAFASLASSTVTSCRAHT